MSGALSRQMWLVYINVALYAACFQAQTPLMPFLVKSLSEDSAMAYAKLSSFFAMGQLAGSLLSGVLVDRLGAKAVLLLSFAASAACYFITAGATDLYILYASRVPTVLQHAVLGGRAYATLATSPQDRTAAFAYLSVAYGVGMVAGPYVGGRLAEISLQTTATAAGYGSLLSFVLIYLLLSEPVATAGTSDAAAAAVAESKPATTIGTNSGSNSGSNNNSSSTLATFAAAFSYPSLRGLLLTKLLFNVASALFQNVISQVAASHFGLDAPAVGQLLSFIGAVGMLVSVGAIKPLTGRYSDAALSLGCLCLLSACFLAFSAATSAAHLYALAVPITFASTVFTTVNSSAITKAADDVNSAAAETDHKGTGSSSSSAPLGKGVLVALDMALGSGVRVFTPGLGALLLTSVWGFPSVGLAAGSGLGLWCVALLTGAAAGAGKRKDKSV